MTEPSLKLARRGSVILIVMTAIILISLIIPGIMGSFRFKNAAQNSYRSEDLTDAVVQAVVARAVSDVTAISRVACVGACDVTCFCPGGGLPNTIQPPFPPVYLFRPAAPRTYGKGEPSFVIPLLQPDGSPFNPPLFLAPETDPQAWIDGNPLQQGAQRYWRLRVRFRACRVLTGKGNPPAAPPYQLGVNWPGGGCPAGQRRDVDYSGLIIRNNI